jgi:hypothetical protein
LIHPWVPDLTFPPALPWAQGAEVPVAANHPIFFSHYSHNNYGLLAGRRIVVFFTLSLTLWDSVKRNLFEACAKRILQN